MLRFPEFEVIVVNDGSDDDTLEVLRQEFSLFPVLSLSTQIQLDSKESRGLYRSADYPNLIVLDQERGGKSSALNAALNVSTYPLFCSVDADTILDGDALLQISHILHEDFSILAAGGVVRVLNESTIEDGRVNKVRAPRQLLVRIQALEYVRGFLTGRMALARFNSLLIVSGTFGLFRKDAVIQIGGYSSDTVSEDMELIARLYHESRKKKRPCRIRFLSQTACWTQVPSDWKSLLRQRDRWQRGLIETLWMHRRMFLNPRHGNIGFIGMTYYSLEAFGPIVETFAYVFIPILFLLGRLNPKFIVLFFMFAVFYAVILSVSALIIDDLVFKRYDRPSDLLRLIIASFLEHLGYRQIVAFQRTLSFLNVLRLKGKWGMIHRTRVSTSEKPSTWRSVN
jgi:cellulose synthase/poly-beta-1,6-N-acetylglucosamine synthase-like glycosyltransferase